MDDNVSYEIEAAMNHVLAEPGTETFWSEPVGTVGDGSSAEFHFETGFAPHVVKRSVELVHELVATRAGKARVSLAALALHWVVLPDGRFHCDPHQAYLMHNDEPHLTVLEWVERKLALI